MWISKKQYESFKSQEKLIDDLRKENKELKVLNATPSQSDYKITMLLSELAKAQKQLKFYQQKYADELQKRLELAKLVKKED